MKTKKANNKKEKFGKDSALKALAKRPEKFFNMISKGGHTIHELKKVGECSGGLIRKMIWAGIAVMEEDKTIKLAKGISKKSLPDVDATPIKVRRAEKKAAKEVKPAKKEAKQVKEEPKKAEKK